jgi:tyrosine-specific transport protein
MAASGLLVAELTVSAALSAQRPGIGLLGATELSLGERAGAFAGVGSAVVQLALLSAYSAQGGSELGALLTLGAHGLGLGTPPALVGPCAFTALLGGLTALGSARAVGALNVGLVSVLLVSFGSLLAVAAPAVSEEQLLAPGDWHAAVGALPICVLALVFHNVIPAVSRSLRGDMAAIRAAVIGGSLLPLAMFLLWDGAILGSTPDAQTLAAPGADPLAPLRALGGAGDGTQAELVGLAVSLFSVSATGTSYLGFAIGQHDVLTDALALERGDRTQDLLAYALALLPPLAVACLLPGVFAPALDAAGTFGVTTLYILLPAAVVWQQRYGAQSGGDSSAPTAPPPALPGGRAPIVAMCALALAIVGEGALDRLGVGVGGLVGL